MRIKKLSIIVLMITLILILTNKSKAVENIEEGKQYNINQEIKIRILPLIYSAEKEKTVNGNITVTEVNRFTTLFIRRLTTEDISSRVLSIISL